MPRLNNWFRFTTKGPQISRINVDPSTRDIVRKAYEFALNHVGQDKDSGEIWSDYIQFLRSGEVCYNCLLSFSSEIRIWSSLSCSSYLTLNSCCFTTLTVLESDLALALVRVMDVRPRFRLSYHN